jgi:TolB-like protein
MESSRFRWQELKRRKIVQWALAYLAGAWLAVEALDLLGEAWGMPPALVRIAHVALAFGFFVVLVLAWYHGEQGRQRVSGPELLMVAALLLIAGVALTVVADDGDAFDQLAYDPGTPRDSIPTRSIAVLPLDNFSPDGENEYFAGAMTEEITNALMKVPELRVAARNSAAKFVDSDLTVGEFVTQELGYAHALEGSVRLQGGRARIVVQLIDGRTDQHVWSDEYEVELIDVLDVQVDIARQVADRLASTFSDREAERIRAGSTDDPRAYDLYLQAMSLMPPESIEDVDRTLVLLVEAVRRDSTFSVAYGELAGAYYVKASMTGDAALMDSTRVALDRAIAMADLASSRAVLRAFQLIFFEEDVAEAISLLRGVVREDASNENITGFLAALYGIDGDLSEAVRWGRHTIALDPLNSFNRLILARHLLVLGLDGAAARERERARELGDRTWDAHFDFHLLRGDYAEAMRFADSARADGDPQADVMAGAAYLGAGDLEEAYAVLRTVGDDVLLIGLWQAAPMIAHVMLLSGDTARAEAVLELASQDIPSAPRDVQVGPLLDAQIAAVRGDAESAATTLRRATELGWRGARWIRKSPVYDRVRADPAFEAALAEQERLVERERREVERILTVEQTGN